jgi:hypothetical protein
MRRRRERVPGRSNILESFSAPTVRGPARRNWTLRWGRGLRRRRRAHCERATKVTKTRNSKSEIRSKREFRIEKFQDRFARPLPGVAVLRFELDSNLWIRSSEKGVPLIRCSPAPLGLSYS